MIRPLVVSTKRSDARRSSVRGARCRPRSEGVEEGARGAAEPGVAGVGDRPLRKRSRGSDIPMAVNGGGFAAGRPRISARSARCLGGQSGHHSTRQNSPWLISTAARVADETEGRRGVEMGPWGPLGSGPRCQVLSHVFARCASQKTYGHARIARDSPWP